MQAEELILRVHVSGCEVTHDQAAGVYRFACGTGVTDKELEAIDVWSVVILEKAHVQHHAMGHEPHQPDDTRYKRSPDALWV